MKRIIKRKGRPTEDKIDFIPKRRCFRRIKNSHKKHNPINAPHNTSQFLIENNSSPFYEDNDIKMDLIPSSLIILDDSEQSLDDNLIYQSKNSSTTT